jgi:hypothetical protein
MVHLPEELAPSAGDRIADGPSRVSYSIVDALSDLMPDIRLEKCVHRIADPDRDGGADHQTSDDGGASRKSYPGRQDHRTFRRDAASS